PASQRAAIIQTRDDAQLLEQAEIVELAPEFDHSPIAVAHNIHTRDAHRFPSWWLSHEWASVCAAVRNKGRHEGCFSDILIDSQRGVWKGVRKAGDQLLSRLAPHHWPRRWRVVDHIRREQWIQQPNVSSSKDLADCRVQA